MSRLHKQESRLIVMRDFWVNLGGKDIVFACDNKI